MQVASEIIEKNGVKITFGCARENRNNHFSTILLLARLLQCSPGHITTADAHRETFLLHEANSGSYSIMIGHRNNMIDQVNPEGVRLETSAQSLNAMRPGSATGQYCTGGWLNGDHFD